MAATIAPMRYPEGIDCEWLACDREGHVAVFITAGCAPIPLVVLGTLEFPDGLDACDDLDVICEAEYLPHAGKPDSFLALARRGWHVYDWQDVHRTRSSNAYELVARPGRPGRVSDLPAGLAALAQAVRFDSLAFARSPAIDPRPLTPCAQGRDC